MKPNAIEKNMVSLFLVISTIVFGCANKGVVFPRSEAGEHPGGTRSGWDGIDPLLRSEFEAAVKAAPPTYPDLKSFVREGVVGIKLTIPSTSYSGWLKGDVSVVSNRWNAEADLVGPIDITSKILNTGFTAGQVNTFSATLATNGVLLANLELDNESQSTFFLSPTGRGVASFSLKVQPASVEWAAILASRVNLVLPAMKNKDGSITFGCPPVNIDVLVPYVPHVFSDFDGDGVLNFKKDYEAFLKAWKQHDWRCDRDVNGVWDDVDLEKWTNDFNEDLAHQHP